MKPGYTFELVQHDDHLLMEVESESHNCYLNGLQASYYNTLFRVCKKIVFRPQLSTQRPTIAGC